MRIVNYRGKWCAVASIDGGRKRLSLGNLAATGAPERCPNYSTAVRAAADLKRQLAKPVGDTCQDIFAAYLADISAIDKARLENAWKALKWKFGPLRPDQITRQACPHIAPPAIAGHLRRHPGEEQEQAAEAPHEPGTASTGSRI